MGIGPDVLNSQPVTLLRDMYTAEYASPASAPADSPAPAILNALGACAGFAAQVAVWRELILPKRRNPGDFLFFCTTHSGDVFFFGEFGSGGVGGGCVCDDVWEAAWISACACEGDCLPRDVYGFAGGEGDLSGGAFSRGICGGGCAVFGCDGDSRDSGQ